MSVGSPDRPLSERVRPEHVMRISCDPAAAANVITVTLERSGHTVAREAVPFLWQLSARDKDDIRWYLEEYLQWQAEPAPRIAARIERRAVRLGNELFEATFPTGGPMRRFWRHAKDHTASLRVQIAVYGELATVPWELLREPGCSPVALQVASFVRVPPRTANLPKVHRDRLRVLLVIARPRRTADVPFRSVANQLVIAAEQHQDVLSIDVLRPPTFDRLEEAVLEALRKGTPYDILHFDGHGVFISTLGEIQANRGYLVFEHPTEANNQEFIDGTTLGQLLSSAQVPAAVLNACESAGTTAAIGAYGAVADELMAVGLRNVVAMRYKIYVHTAAAFVSELYPSLTRGGELGEAVTRSRKILAIDPVSLRSSGARPLLDWIVPVVYECADSAGRYGNAAEPPAEARPERPTVPRVVAEHYGREETLLEIDRAFDSCNAVLMHGFAGIGKSTTASAFARWYIDTNGASSVATSHVETGMEVTAPQDQPLWIVDGIDRAQASEIPGLLCLLRRVAATGTKVLATSRAPIASWPGDTGVTLTLPPMSIDEQMDFLEKLVTRGGGAAADFAVWSPALQFSSGIPGVIVPIVVATLKKGNETEQSLRVLSPKSAWARRSLIQR
jgi:CHAT domain